MAGIGDGRGEYMRLGFGSIPSLLFCFVSPFSSASDLFYFFFFLFFYTFSSHLLSAFFLFPVQVLAQSVQE
jgi:hypothetical protein